MNFSLNEGSLTASKIAAALLSSLLALTVNAQGQYASDSDLKAAFCLPYMNSVKERLKKIESETPTNDTTILNIREAGDIYDKKLRTYLAARTQSHNSEAKSEVMAAIKVGEQATSVYNKIAAACISQVKTNSISQYSKELENCREKNGVKLLKLDICNNLDFLPY